MGKKLPKGISRVTIAKTYEIVIRGLPLPNGMAVGVRIAPKDLHLLQQTGRLIVDAMPTTQPVQPPIIPPDDAKVDQKAEKVEEKV